MNDASVTMRQEGAGRSSGKLAPVLFLVGSARNGGALEAARVQFIPELLEIGRARGDTESGPGARLDLPDKLLSRVHLRLHPVSGGCDAEDAESTNGTFLDGRRLVGRGRLADGSLLLFGGHAAIFRRVTDEAMRAIAEEVAEPFGPVATVSPAMATLLWRLRRLARSGTEILITGETGTGKEVYARAVHRASQRTGPLVAINCAAIPSELAESELFGYARGAHSTATEAKPGLIQSADGGTLFLDEIGDMNPGLQAKLLRFLQDRQVTPLGSTTAKRVNVQVVAATNNAGAGGELRSDLAARLGAQALCLPPLRERIEDVGALIHHFLTGSGAATAPEIEPAAFHALCHYTWPRNVRELQKVIAETVAVSEGAACIRLAHLPQLVTEVMEPVSGPSAPAVAAKRAAPSRDELQELLRTHDGNVAQIARALDRQWAVVWRWIVKHELDPGQYRK
jgi:transcriptional regulator with PAS, ATPase and Fis domain